VVVTEAEVPPAVAVHFLLEASIELVVLLIHQKTPPQAQLSWQMTLPVG